MPLVFPFFSVQSPDQVLSQVPEATSSSSPFFLTFFASIDPNTGESWCIDCRKAQPVIDQHVPEANSALVFVGDRSEWKSSPLREAFGISRIPTIVKLTSKPSATSSTSSHLVESDILDQAKLKKFLNSE
ncbi:BQ5605_C012g07005 [Microbotryum silenes-dioicae]|uniref:BQ5605_C012g07005 protein n=1 Tax=Microbotryum silenes-dioicae TaxID=796604 RepID=A0A2X0LSJ0_9BASI|nr:BQ5605_C012g07005 [Microbotryum silenes-dioicae]